jgi:hypothetical protein
VYLGYYYHGLVYYYFVPAYYYAPAFYGWAFDPWVSPVVYAWGWGPWYGAFGYYFAPYPVYAEASLWLTDYLLAANLQAAYEARAQEQAARSADTGAAPPPPDAANVSLSPEVKQAIAAEVKAQLAAERDAAQSPPPPMDREKERVPAALDPNHRTFIVSNTINAVASDGMDCSLSSGDVLTRIGDTPDAHQQVKVLVSSSQRDDCRSGSQLDVSVRDLQEMHNQFRAKLNEGLGRLGESQGSNGLPSGPPASPREVAEAKAQPDLTAIAELQRQEEDAKRTEKEVLEAAGSGHGH